MLQRIRGVIALLAFLFVYGIVGSMELDKIKFGCGAAYCVIGLVVFIWGAWPFLEHDRPQRKE